MPPLTVLACGDGLGFVTALTVGSTSMSILGVQFWG